MVKTYYISPESNNNTKSIKSKIAEALFNRYGFKTKDPELDEPIFIPKHKYSFFNSLFDKFWARKNQITSPLIYARTLVEDAKPHDQRIFENAMLNLHEYAEYLRSMKSKDYDYTIAGIPVKWYDTFVQVGSYIIPLDGYSNYYEKIKSPKIKKNIISMMTIINSTIVEELAA